MPSPCIHWAYYQILNERSLKASQYLFLTFEVEIINTMAYLYHYNLMFEMANCVSNKKKTLLLDPQIDE